MHHRAAFRVQYLALELRALHPKAPAIAVLDQAMSGYLADDLPVRQWLADRAMPTTPFGQLLLAAFGCRMTAAEWRIYTGDAADPELAATVLDIWPTLVIAGFTQRYQELRAGGGLQTPARAAPAVVRRLAHVA